MRLFSDRATLRGASAFACIAAVFVMLCGEAMARPLLIGVALPSFRESRWNLDLQALRSSADKNQVDILVRFAGNSQEQQNLQIKEIINIGVDALIVVPDDVDAVASAVAFAKSRNVPVISYDRLARNSDLDAYVTFEQERVGELMGAFLVSVAPKGNYILISGASQDSNSALFKKGAMKYIAPLIQRGDITVIAEGEATNWKESAARAIVESALEQTNDIAAILAPNDDTARGVIAALAPRGLVGKVPVTGQDATADALERIFTGQQSITIYKDTRMLAQKAIQAAVCLMRGAPLPADSFSDNVFKKVPTYTIPVTYIDRDILTWFLRLPETHN